MLMALLLPQQFRHSTACTNFIEGTDGTMGALRARPTLRVELNIPGSTRAAQRARPKGEGRIAVRLTVP